MTSTRSRSQKATFNLSPGVLADLERAVAAGAAPSKNAFVERALASALEELRREQRRQAWDEARRDPQFLRDLEEVEADFGTVDAETARSIG